MITQGDFHIHSPYCPHGSNDLMESYVLEAIEKGLQYITFTEHAPLPKNFNDPTPDQDSAMKWEDIEDYFNEANRLKNQYKEKITIYIGLEVDYIEGYEEEITSFLDQYGKFMDDSILSVHMLKAPNGEYVCLDFSETEFERIIQLFGSVDKVYAWYYRTIKKSIHAQLGSFKPIRVGHITLVEKFSKLFPASTNFKGDIEDILQLMKQNNLELDVNTSGYFKAYNGKIYPDPEIIKLASDLNIPLITGSDSHASNDIARGFDLLPDGIFFTAPAKRN
ncbi:histidinol-phosphatase HisJ [Aquibacillus albus]|uniref:Histidinol-phosphatase n=1 Tax=Aquibacillus albus TaxID=1168171 RepID=A0ABS2N2D9_9BACI|nr:histidinol-phosphatase HisJ [Aquibacillus albus]MBM7572268.1 histidinol-phosphatase (PHP family) [Aquibacillus albus]